ncbi:MAG: ATP-dependent protease subunit HslV [Chlorobi bacterium]|nr:ATP-dependent protease subunit HslV [Chlorobiota bacterium]
MKHHSSICYGTTVIAVLRDGKACIGSDGQVSLDATIVKSGARKVRRLYNDTVLAGFAGATADAFTLLERFDEQLGAHRGNLARSAVELAKAWRTDRFLRRLEAMLVAANKTEIVLISGNGDVIVPDDNIAAVGSGGNYALAAARVLMRHTNMNARQIVEESLRVASEICVFTNDRFTIEELP